MGVFFSFMSALAYSANNITVKKGIDQAKGVNNGYFITVIINVIVLGLFLLGALIFRGFQFYFSWIGFIAFIISGVLTTGFGRTALFAAIGRINPSRTSAIKNGAPVFTVLFALTLLGEYLNWQTGIGISFMVGAFSYQAAIIFRKTKGINTAEERSYSKYWKGYLLAIIAALFFGIGQGVRKQGLLAMDDAFFGAWIGSLTALAFFVVRHSLTKKLKAEIKSSIGTFNMFFITSGVLSTMGPLCFFIASTLTQVSIVSTIIGSEPLLTILLSALLLKGQEKLTISIWITASLILIGSILIVLGS